MTESRNGLSRPKRTRGSGFKMVNMGEIFAYDRIRNPEMDRVPMDDAELERFCLRPGDLLFARQSLVLEGAGKCSIVLETPEPTTFESHLIRVRLDQALADPAFFYYYFNSHYGKGSVASIVMQVAAAGIRGSELATLQVPSPPLPVQKSIASILSAYDDLIENNTGRIKILEQMAQMLYREWFVNFRFPGHEKVRKVESELGPIPEGWTVESLGELADITMGQSPPSESYNTVGTGLLFHQGVTDFGRRFPADRMYCTIGNRLAEPQDILMSVRAPVGRLNISTKKIVIGRGLCAVRSNFGQQAILFQQLNEHFQEEDTMGSGTIFKAVTKQDVHGIKFIRADAKIATETETWLKPLFRQLEVLSSKNSNLRATRDLLLPKLISGEISVDKARPCGADPSTLVERNG